MLNYLIQKHLHMHQMLPYTLLSILHTRSCYFSDNIHTYLLFSVYNPHPNTSRQMLYSHLQ